MRLQRSDAGANRNHRRRGLGRRAAEVLQQAVEIDLQRLGKNARFRKRGSVIGPDSATIGRIPSDNGYATSWFGKNHNTPSFQYSAAGPFDQWPSGMGFQYFYGFMGGETDQWTPHLFHDHSPVFPWVGRKDYNLAATARSASGMERTALPPERPYSKVRHTDRR